MDQNAYKMIRELYELINKNDARIMSAADIAYALGVLRTMLTLYKDTLDQPSETTEARKPPVVRQAPKLKWYQKLFG